MTTLTQSFQLIEIPEQLDLGWIKFTDLKRWVAYNFKMLETHKEKSVIYKAAKNHLEFILKNILKSFSIFWWFK